MTTTMTKDASGKNQETRAVFSGICTEGLEDRVRVFDYSMRWTK
jgi:hypothetical protein